MQFNDKISSLTAEGNRITVRPLTLSDYESFVHGYQNCLPSQNRFDEGTFDTGFMTPAWYQALLERRQREAMEDYSYLFHIFCKEDGKSLGYCDITPHRRENFQYARIGYTIFNNFWGKGYATECVECLVKLGFGQLKLHRLEAHVNLDNPASKKVLKKVGFTYECIRKGFILEDGIWTDNEIYYRNQEG